MNILSSGLVGALVGILIGFAASAGVYSIHYQQSGEDLRNAIYDLDAIKRGMREHLEKIHGKDY